MTDTRMDELRMQLDNIDEQVIDLFAQRYRLRDEMMPVKIAKDIPVEVTPRANAVIERAVKMAEEKNLPADFARALYQLVIDYSHKYEEEYRKTLDSKETS